jgi:hypothetical protein
MHSKALSEGKKGYMGLNKYIQQCVASLNGINHYLFSEKFLIQLDQDEIIEIFRSN